MLGRIAGRVTTIKVTPGDRRLHRHRILAPTRIRIRITTKDRQIHSARPTSNGQLAAELNQDP